MSELGTKVTHWFSKLRLKRNQDHADKVSEYLSNLGDVVPDEEKYNKDHITMTPTKHGFHLTYIADGINVQYSPNATIKSNVTYGKKENIEATFIDDAEMIRVKLNRGSDLHFTSTIAIRKDDPTNTFSQFKSTHEHGKARSDGSFIYAMGDRDGYGPVSDDHTRFARAFNQYYQKLHVDEFKAEYKGMQEANR